MSASGPPGPEELMQEFPIDPLEAQALADALSPLQDIANAGSSAGAALENAPGPGPKLAGVLLQNASTHVDLASISAETFARAVAFYMESQVGSFETVFPPPQAALQQFNEDLQPLADAINEQSLFTPE